jgi:hypothetical protein
VHLPSRIDVLRVSGLGTQRIQRISLVATIPEPTNKTSAAADTKNTNKTDLRVLPPSLRFLRNYTLYVRPQPSGWRVRETTLARPASKHGVAPALIHNVRGI